MTLLLALLVALFPNSEANDSAASRTLDGIRLEKTDKIAMRSEILNISPNQISVEYVFENTSENDVSNLIAFPIPPLEEWGNDWEFSDFKVYANDKLLSNSREVKVTMDDKDVTKRYEKLNLKDQSELNAKKLDAATRKRLDESGLFSFQAPYYVPLFTVDIKYHWTQNFPSKQKVKIKHTYTPRPGFNSVWELNHDWKESLPGRVPNCWHKAPLQMEESEAKECVNVKAREGLGDLFFGSEYLEYIISTGSNWKSGIEDFKLSVSGAAIILTDIDGKQDVDLEAYSLHMKNFHPKKELLIEFVGTKLKPRLPHDIKVTKKIDGPANCRDTPAGKIIRSIPNQASVVLRARKNEWYLISESGKECWTNRKNLRFL